MASNGGTFNLGSSDSATFTIQGGVYGVAALATFGGGNIDLKVRGPDGSTYLSVLDAAFTAAGTKLSQLPAGTYKFTVTTATAAFASVLPIQQRV